MSFFGKLKQRLFTSSSRLDKGLDEIVAQGNADSSTEDSMEATALGRAAEPDTPQPDSPEPDTPEIVPPPETEPSPDLPEQPEAEPIPEGPVLPETGEGAPVE